jgi:hypothetical protein
MSQLQVLKVFTVTNNFLNVPPFQFLKNTYYRDGGRERVVEYGYYPDHINTDLVTEDMVRGCQHREEVTVDSPMRALGVYLPALRAFMIDGCLFTDDHAHFHRLFMEATTAVNEDDDRIPFQSFTVIYSTDRDHMVFFLNVNTPERDDDVRTIGPFYHIVGNETRMSRVLTIRLQKLKLFLIRRAQRRTRKQLLVFYTGTYKRRIYHPDPIVPEHQWITYEDNPGCTIPADLSMDIKRMIARFCHPFFT